MNFFIILENFICLIISSSFMEHGFLLRRNKDKMYYAKTLIFDDEKPLSLISHPDRIRILDLISVKPMYAIEIAKSLKMNEQKVYYHLNQLLEADVLEIAERKDIRGTVAKKYRPKAMNFSLMLKKPASLLGEVSIAGLFSGAHDKAIVDFLYPFISDGEFNAKIVVGNPDPHGQHKARARDGHLAIDLALFFGSFCSVPVGFPALLDVELKDLKQNLIVVGGPVTNLIANRINKYLAVRFSEVKPFGLKSLNTGRKFTDENIGIIARIPNPFSPEHYLIYLSGIGISGTRAAVISMTRQHDELLSSFMNQKEFYKVVQGFDLDGDGSIDHADVLE